MSDFYLGEIRIFPYNRGVPEGWLECDGSVVAISTYPVLHAFIGGAYGGDGQTTFGLPDLRGRIPLHAGAGPGRTPRKAGDMGGSETVTLGLEHIPQHTHVVYASTNPATANTPADGVLAAQIPPPAPPPAPPPPPPADGGGFLATMPNAGVVQTFAAGALGTTGGAAHDNMMPTIVLRFAIAYQGL